MVFGFFTRWRSSIFSVPLAKRGPGGLSLRLDGRENKIGSLWTKSEDRLDILLIMVVVS